MSTSTDIKLLPYQPLSYPVRFDTQHGLVQGSTPTRGRPAGFPDGMVLRSIPVNSQRALSYDARQRLRDLDPRKTGTFIDTYV